MRRRDRRSRRREAGRGRRALPPQIQPVSSLSNRLPFTEVLGPEGVQRIHQASMRLLKETGMLVLDYPAALETFKKHGAKVDGQMVWIDEDILMHFVQQAPSTFTQLARNPANNLPLGGNKTVFAPVYGPPYVADLDRGRRQAPSKIFVILPNWFI